MPNKNKKFGLFFAKVLSMKKEPPPSSSPKQSEPDLENAFCCCPHWAAVSKTCMLVKEGLFLPVLEHIAAYCTSQHYPSCQYYQRLASEQHEPMTDDRCPINRRRSVRVPQYHLFRFSELHPHTRTPQNRLEETWTIDVSEHGLRFASYHHLQPDTLISFSIEGSNGDDTSRGEARVIWSEPLENTPLFHAGIAFSY